MNINAARIAVILTGLLITMTLTSRPLPAADPAARTKTDVEYATVDGHTLKLDLYQPGGDRPAPVIVWVHGGAWRSGSKSPMPLGALVRRGYAVASVDYRLSPVARFPAQVHDIKAAIRFLRAGSDTYRLDPGRVAIAGASAGGHLAALVGTTNGHPELEGTVGTHPEQSSDVQAIVSFYGMSNLTTILSQSTPHGLSVRVPALQLLLGGQPDAVPDLAKLASPTLHAGEDDPALLLIHGDQDPQAPIEQSVELSAAYRKARRPVRMDVIPGAVHGGAEFFDSERMEIVEEFLKAHLEAARPGVSR